MHTSTVNIQHYCGKRNFRLTWNQRCFLISWTPSFWYPILSTGFSLQNLFISVTAVLKKSYLVFAVLVCSLNVWHSCWNWITLNKMLLSLSNMSHHTGCHWVFLSWMSWCYSRVTGWHDKESRNKLCLQLKFFFFSFKSSQNFVNCTLMFS